VAGVHHVRPATLANPRTDALLGPAIAAHARRGGGRRGLNRREKRSSGRVRDVERYESLAERVKRSSGRACDIARNKIPAESAPRPLWSRTHRTVRMRTRARMRTPARVCAPRARTSCPRAYAHPGALYAPRPRMRPLVRQVGRRRLRRGRRHPHHLGRVETLGSTLEPTHSCRLADFPLHCHGQPIAAAARWQGAAPHTR
jgi:hypothetical protein